MGNDGFGDRSGVRTKEQRRLEMIRRATSAQNKFGIGGRKKEGAHAPKPVTLPTIKLPDLDAD